MEPPAWRASRRIEIPPPTADGSLHLDFFCHEVGLVVEVDGRSHDERGKEDSQREAFLREQQRLQVLRVSNDDVLKETEAVLFAILRAAGKEVV